MRQSEVAAILLAVLELVSTVAFAAAESQEQRLGDRSDVAAIAVYRLNTLGSIWLAIELIVRNWRFHMGYDHAAHIANRPMRALV